MGVHRTTLRVGGLCNLVCIDSGCLCNLYRTTHKERYLHTHTLCYRGTECHQKVLKLFQDDPSPSALDLSRLSLRPVNLPPLLTSLQGHSSLTSLSLCATRLESEGVALLATSVSRHPNLKTLDLSCTGLTPQVITHGTSACTAHS